MEGERQAGGESYAREVLHKNCVESELSVCVALKLFWKQSRQPM